MSVHAMKTQTKLKSAALVKTNNDTGLIVTDSLEIKRQNIYFKHFLKKNHKNSQKFIIYRLAAHVARSALAAPSLALRTLII